MRCVLTRTTNHVCKQLGQSNGRQGGIDLERWDTLYFLFLGCVTIFKGQRDLTVEFDSEFEGLEGYFE